MAYKKPRPQPVTADETKREAFYDTVEDRIGGRDEDSVVVTIDQLRKPVGADSPTRGFRSTSGQRLTFRLHARSDLLGALTHYYVASFRWTSMGSDEGTLSPDEAFWLLGDETRIAILRAVWESSDETVSFTEIRKRLGNPNSGQFNYHLNKLKGHFLSTVEDGYRLTQAGREVVRAVMAGTITQRPETDPVPIDAQCVECGGTLVARYDEYGIIECGDCGASVMWNEFPPAGLEGRTPKEVATTFDRWTRSRFRLAMDGTCPNCAAEMSTEILDPGSDADEGVATNHRCKNCKYEARVPLFGHVLHHPAVVSFYYEMGVDVTEMPYWQMQALAREFTEEVISENPWEAEITIESDGRELGLTLDEQLDVVDVEWTDR